MIRARKYIEDLTDDELCKFLSLYMSDNVSCLNCEFADACDNVFMACSKVIYSELMKEAE